VSLNKGFAASFADFLAEHVPRVRLKSCIETQVGRSLR
jgi:hypothetical protein